MCMGRYFKIPLDKTETFHFDEKREISNFKMVKIFQFNFNVFSYSI